MVPNDANEVQALIAENDELRRQLNEANSILDAIKYGEIDALFVQGEDDDQIYILKGADYLYRALVEEMQEGYVTLASNGTILFSNKNFAEMLRTPLEELRGQSLFRFVNYSIRDLKEHFIRQDSNFKFELTLRAKNNIIVPVLASGRILNIEGELYACIVITDLTELKSAECLMRTVFNQAGEAIIICNQTGRIVEANTLAYDFLGAGMDRGSFAADISLYKETTGERLDIWQELQSGPIRSLKVYNNKPDGDSSSFLLSAGFLQGEWPGEFLGYIITLTNITEYQQITKEMRRFENLNLIGEMAASIGHEVRNPMTTVRGYLQWFLGRPNFDQYGDSLSVMIEELDRANMIISDFLSLAKDKSLDIRPLNLNKVIEALFPLMQADALRKGHQVKLLLADIPDIMAEEKEIRQCLLNLVRNGLEAMTVNGTIEIKTSIAPNEQVILAIHDEGPGIPLDIKEKLGTPFFTTKENGTGLGLTVCYSIARRHKAKIEIESGAKGTTFFITFNSI